MSRSFLVAALIAVLVTAEQDQLHVYHRQQAGHEDRRVGVGLERRRRHRRDHDEPRDPRAGRTPTGRPALASRRDARTSRRRPCCRCPRPASRTRRSPYGSGSTDQAGDPTPHIKAYHWDIGGNARTTASATTSETWSRNGTKTIRLRVEVKDGGFSAWVQRTITILSAPPVISSVSVSDSHVHVDLHRPRRRRRFAGLGPARRRLVRRRLRHLVRLHPRDAGPGHVAVHRP